MAGFSLHRRCIAIAPTAHEKTPTHARTHSTPTPPHNPPKVLSSRLQLPLSSIDSDDTDAQPIYRITYHGASFLSDPVPLGSRRRSKTGRLGLRRRPGLSTGRAGPSGGVTSGVTRPGSPGATAGDAGKKVAPADDILARAAFTYAAEGKPPLSSSAATTQPPSSSYARAAAAGGGSAALSTAAAAAAAAETTAPSAKAAPIGSSATSGGSSSSRRRRWMDYGLLIECCDSEAAPSDEVMGSVEIDVAQRLALTDTGHWEGWLKLNKVCLCFCGVWKDVIVGGWVQKRGCVELDLCLTHGSRFEHISNHNAIHTTNAMYTGRWSHPGSHQQGALIRAGRHRPPTPQECAHGGHCRPHPPRFHHLRPPRHHPSRRRQQRSRRCRRRRRPWECGAGAH